MQEQCNKVRVCVTQGSGEPAQMHFMPGEKAGPTSLGASAEWRVSATAVLPIHAYIYYDGARLFLRSAQDRNRISVDGRAVGEDWLALEVPCSVRMGLAVLSISAETDEQVDTSDSDETQQIVPLLAANVVRRLPTTAEPPAPAKPAAATSVLLVEVMMAARRTARQAPKRARVAGAPPSRPAFAVESPKPDGTETVLAPVMARDASQAELSPQRALKQGPVAPEAQRTPMDAAQPSAVIAIKHAAAPPPPPPPPPVSPSPREPSAAALPLEEALRPALPLEAIAGLLPPAPSATFNGTPQGLAAAPVLQTDAGVGGANALGSRLQWLKRQWSGSSRAKKASMALILPATLLMGIMLMKGATRRPPTEASAAPVNTVIAASEGARSTSAATSAPTNAAPSGLALTAAAGASAAPVVPVKPGPANALSPRASNAKTLQRRAVDAVAAGSYEEAARIYDELAQINAAETAYAEAARILRAKHQKP